MEKTPILRRIKNAWIYSKLRIALQPYMRWFANWSSYHLYCLRRSGYFRLRYFVNLVFLVSLYPTIRDLCSISLKTIFSAESKPLVWILLTVISAVFEIIQRVRDTKTKMAEKHVVQQTDKDYYHDVEAPDDGQAWEKRVVYTLCGGSVNRSTMFFCSKVNEWLQDGDKQKEVCLKEKKDGRKKLSGKLSGEHFTNLYYHFLRYNYRSSQFFGKQFTNEKKWGLCSNLTPESSSILVHKTCYYDSYLTNIAPGKILLATRDGNTVASLEAGKYEYDPFFIEKQDDKITRKVLFATGEQTPMANEPGVTTLMILNNGEIPLWIQSNQAQSNPGQVMVAGSGSADWEDCRPFLGEADGLRKAVITGMERELYEESIGKRTITEKEFKKHAKTMVTGYFRWLEKGGKSEFVGFSCVSMDQTGADLSPEESEVYRYERDKMKAKTVGQLRAVLETLVHTAETETGKKELEEYDIHSDAPKEIVIISKCNLSSTAAIFMLQQLIDAACKEDKKIADENAYRWLLGLAQNHDCVTH